MKKNMELKNGKFYVVSIGKTKLIEAEKNDAITKLVELVNKQTADISTLNPEIVEVDTVSEKWVLKSLAWNVIALELMRMKK
jgi:UDP-N-acetylglucosamine enolpyruvyl transferase